jgi:hypothetical protein
MSFNRKVLLCRLACSLLIFIISWAILSGASSLLFDKVAVVKSLDDQDWIKFLSPRIRNYIVVNGWQLVAALVVAFFSYKKLKGASVKLVTTFFSNQESVLIEWGASEDNPCAEFLMFMETGDNPLGACITNTSPTDLQITRIDASIYASTGVGISGGNIVQVNMEEIIFRANTDEGEDFQWKKMSDRKWYVDYPVTIKENETFFLPYLHPDFDSTNGKIVEKIQKIIGDPSIEIHCTISVFGNHNVVTHDLDASLRIFNPYELWGDNDDEALELVNQLDLKTDTEKNRRRQKPKVNIGLRFNKFDFSLRLLSF